MPCSSLPFSLFSTSNLPNAPDHDSVSTKRTHTHILGWLKFSSLIFSYYVYKHSTYRVSSLSLLELMMMKLEFPDRFSFSWFHFVYLRIRVSLIQHSLDRLNLQLMSFGSSQGLEKWKLLGKRIDDETRWWW